MEYKTHTHTALLFLMCVPEPRVAAASWQSEEQVAAVSNEGKQNYVLPPFGFSSLLHLFLLDAQLPRSVFYFTRMRLCMLPFFILLFLDEYTVERQAPFGGREGGLEEGKGDVLDMLIK